MWHALNASKNPVFKLNLRLAKKFAHSPGGTYQVMGLILSLNVKDGFPLEHGADVLADLLQALHFRTRHIDFMTSSQLQRMADSIGCVRDIDWVYFYSLFPMKDDGTPSLHGNDQSRDEPIVRLPRPVDEEKS
jgi:hypothetical protein